MALEEKFPKQTAAEVMDSAFADFQADVASEQEETEPTEEAVEKVDLEETEDVHEEEESEDSLDLDSEETEEIEEAEEDSELPDVITVKADGKNVTIDFKDRDKITKVFQKFVAQSRYLKERDDYKSQLDEINSPESQHSKNQDMINLLNENIEDPSEMYRLFTGGKDIKELFKEWQKEEDSFALLSEPEQKAYLNAKAQEAKQKDLDRREAALNRKVQDSEERKSNAELVEQQSLMTSSFEQHRFNEVTDPDEALKLDKRLWNDVKSRLGGYEDINKEIINREMKEAADELRSLLGRRGRVEAKKESVAKKKKAKKAVAKAVTVPKEEEPQSFMDGLAAAMNPF